MFTFIDLFAGIGGFRVALQRQGLNCVFTSEIDEKARNVYERNFNDKTHGDICKIKEEDIPSHDILCAGFPCQSFSISGKRTGLKDTRGRLFYEIVRVARYHKPLVLLLENVRNILTIDNGEVIKTIYKEFNDIGYDVQYCILNASEFGYPQSRKRVYFVCLKKEANLDFRPPFPTHKPIFLRDILDSNIDERLIIKRDDFVIRNTNEPKPKLAPIRIGEFNKGGQGDRIYHPNGHSTNLTANGGGRGAKTGLYLIDGKVRKLSVGECRRLMGFEEGHYVDSGVHGYRQVGNAVIPGMIEKVFQGIKFL